MTKRIGILTAGGDSPGLNAAIRGVGKTALERYKIEMIGFLDGFRGLVDNRWVPLNGQALSGILTRGGTILGTSRDKPHAMWIDGEKRDMTDVIAANYKTNKLDALVCIGGGGTQKNALQLMNKGLNIITLPKTIDNDVAGTDVTFGFDTALGIATDAIDRLHDTAHSHHRIIVVEIMGHRSGWLALGSGIAGGADVILLPEIPYQADVVAEAIRERVKSGKNFSIVAVAEGALPVGEAKALKEAQARKAAAKTDKELKAAEKDLAAVTERHLNHIQHLSLQLEKLTGLESRVTILGHLQRGGTPSAGDRLLATRLGAAAADLIHKGKFGVMVAARGDQAVAVPLDEVAGKKKLVPADHPWLQTARSLGTCLGD